MQCSATIVLHLLLPRFSLTAISHGLGQLLGHAAQEVQAAIANAQATVQR